MPSAADKWPLVLLTHLTLTQSWFNTENAVYPATWSISTEWAFYIVFAVVILFLPKVRNALISLVMLCIAAPVFLLVVFANRDAVLTFLSGSLLLHDHASAELWPWFIYFCPLVRIAEFAAGALAASVYRNGTANVSHGLATVAAGWCIFILAFGGIADDTIFANFLPNFAFAPALVVIILYLTKENIASRVLGSTAGVALGEISYAVYLLQHQYFVKYGWIDIPILRVAAHIAFITGMSGLYFLLYEAPMRWVIRRTLIRGSSRLLKPKLAVQ